MTEWSCGIPPIPGETGRRARAVFGENNFYLRLGDRLPALLQEMEPALSLVLPSHSTLPVPLHALVTFFQMAEELSDRQASDALRTRIDWQYALHLPANYRTLREEDLCAFRQTLYSDGELRQAFFELAKRLADLNGPSGLYTEVVDLLTPVIAICHINRMKWILQAICDMLGVLAIRRAEWLNGIAQAHWYASYWSDQPQLAGLAIAATAEEIAALGKRLGDDAHYLLASLGYVTDLNSMEVSGMRRLERVWRQQYEAGRGDDSRLMPFCSFCIQAGGAQLQEGA